MSRVTGDHRCDGARRASAGEYSKVLEHGSRVIKEDSHLFPYAAAAACGLIVYLVITVATGRNEAWDDGSYYVLGIPLMCAVAFVIGYRFPSKPWRWALSIAGGQMIGAFLCGSSFNLLPFALVFMIIISIPQLFAASLGARFARKKAAAG